MRNTTTRDLLQQVCRIFGRNVGTSENPSLVFFSGFPLPDNGNCQVSTGSRMQESHFLSREYNQVDVFRCEKGLQMSK